MPLDMKYVVGDFETASPVDLKKAGAARYAEDPCTEVICFGFNRVGSNHPASVWTPADGMDSEIGQKLLALVTDDSVVWIAHNAFFEKMIWRKVMVEVYGWPDIPDHRWHDTMAVCAMKALPQDLDRASLVLRLGIQKDKEGSALAKSLSKPNKKTGEYDRSPATLQRVYTYCGTDVEGEIEMHQRIGWLPAGERRVWLLDQRINQRGVKLDMDYVRACQQIVDKASAPLEREFGQITGLKTTQRDKFMSWLRDEGVNLPNLTKETLDELFGSEEDDDAEYDSDVDVELPVHAERALRIRRLIGSASIKKLARMEACVCADGRARGLLQYHGAGPGRWAGRLLQPQNFPRGSLEQLEAGLDDAGKVKKKALSVEQIVNAVLTEDPDYVHMVLGQHPMDVVVSGLRHAIVAEKGRRVVAGDFNTIELRVNLSIAGQDDKVEMLKNGADPYIDMAQLIYKRPLNKKDNPEERQTGKNSVLGLGFQMGAPKFRTKYAKEHPIEFAEEIVRIFRKEWAPNVPQNWYGFEGAAVRAVWDRKPQEYAGVTYQLEDGWLTARLPSGRKLWYFNPQPVRKAMPWDETDVRLAWTYQVLKMGKWQTIDAYGGLLTENVVQALARDLMAHAMLKAEANGMPVILTVHDEIVTEPLAGDADPKALDQIMRDVPVWARELNIPVAAEVWVGDRYKK